MRIKLYLVPVALLFIAPAVISGSDTISAYLDQEHIKSEICTPAEIFTTGIIPETKEKEMEIERWMINPKDPFWQDDDIRLESWMSDIKNPFWSEMLPSDPESEIEEWMIKPSSWFNAALIAVK